MREPGSILVVGMPTAGTLPDASLYVGSRRWLAAAPPGARTVELTDLEAALDAIDHTAGRVCVLASGDPGFFGIVRALASRFGPTSLDVRPAVSSVSLAFARLGMPWDDATVISAHGRPLPEAARAALGAPKAAVLVSPEAPPEAVAKELIALGAQPTTPAAVCARLGLPGESVTRTDLAGVAGGTWDPLSVLVLWRGDGVAPAASLAWGRPDAAFAHRGGMITKAEVRAVVLGKLALPPVGVLWDVGAGSGSVALEAASLCPGLCVFAIERDAGLLRRNAAGTAVRVIEGTAPAALDGLPDPDRAFVGGGGTAVLDAVCTRLRPGGVVVATYAALSRAAAAAERLGNIVQIGVARGRRLPDGSFRLAAENPVFVVWGPEQ